MARLTGDLRGPACGLAALPGGAGWGVGAAVLTWSVLLGGARSGVGSVVSTWSRSGSLAA